MKKTLAKCRKKNWKHVRWVKNDRTGTAPLKENGLLVSDSKSKASILNHQYQYSAQKILLTSQGPVNLCP